MFPQTFIQQVKNSTDMLELVKLYTDNKINKVGDGVYNLKCPHPDHNDRTPSFTIWSKFNSWACYGCHSGKKSDKYNNYGSDCIAFVRFMEGCTWREAVLKLAELNNIPKPTEENDKEYKVQYDLAKKYHNSLLTNNEVLQYLYNRGIDNKDIKEWLLGWDGEKITFPLLDRYRNVIGFTRRWLNMPAGRNDKYRNSKESSIFNKSKYFYGIHKLDMRKKYVRITEGTVDVIKAIKYGASNVIATLGTAFTEEHAKEIKRLGLIPVLVYDGDDAGRKAMKKAAGYLAELGIYCKVVVLEDGKDLADIVDKYQDYTEDFLLSEAQSFGFYLAKGLSTEYHSKLYDLKAEIASKINNVLIEVPDSEKILVKSFLEDELKIRI